MILNIGKSYFEAEITTVSYLALNDCLIEKKDLDSVIVVEKNSENDVSYISANAYKLNLLSVKLSQSFTDSVKKRFSGSVKVPIGVFSGISMLSGFGSKVKINMIEISNVSCSFSSVFSEAGINQTRHVLKLIITPEAKIISQTKVYELKREIEVIIYDNIIVGKVPNAYLNGNISYG